MSVERDGLSGRMLHLTRWYSCASPPCRKLTPHEKAVMRLRLAPSYRPQSLATPNGRSRRDGTRP